MSIAAIFINLSCILLYILFGYTILMVRNRSKAYDYAHRNGSWLYHETNSWTNYSIFIDYSLFWPVILTWFLLKNLIKYNHMCLIAISNSLSKIIYNIIKKK